MNTHLFSAITFIIYFFILPIHADVLPSWNEGPIKQAILRFVEETTLEGSPNYIPPAERIATFDEDGTLWVEQPLYTEGFFALDRLKAMALNHPEWKEKNPLSILLTTTIENLKHLPKKDIEELIAFTHSGMSVDEFHVIVNEWLDKAVHPRFQKPFTSLVYQPMIEVIDYLRDHQFDIYIVSGGGQEFIRAFAEKVYGIPPSHVIGTAAKVKYEYQDGNPILLKLPDILFVDDKDGKVEGINLIIGQHPHIAFGNSTGDKEMLEWTQANKGKNLEILIHHDDERREYAYGPDSRIGTFPKSLMAKAKEEG